MGLQFTYPTLVSAIQQYTLEGISLTNTDFSAFLPTIIQIAEERIIRDLNINIFDVESTGNLVSGNSNLAIPSAYLGIRYFMLSTDGVSYVPLVRKDITWIENYWRNPNSLSVPVYYGVFGNGNPSALTGSFRLAPTPDSTYSYKLRYIQRPASMSASNPETWLGDHAADCLLYVCLAESMAYLREDLSSEQGLTAMFESKYANCLAKLKQELSNQVITGFYF